MDHISMTTDGMSSAAERSAAWHDVVCKMIRNVGLARVSESSFSARIAARRSKHVGVAKFWSRAHEIVGARESLSDHGGSGYLVSWQLEGDAHIEVEDERFVLVPGQVAIIDGRRGMRVRFPGDVQRMVANVPASVLESRLPQLRSRNTLVLRPRGPFSATLRTYFEELSSGDCDLAPDDMHLVVENICNLLRVVSPEAFDESRDARTVLYRTMRAHVRAKACDVEFTLDSAAVELGVSRRLLQKVLQENGVTFTAAVLEARLDAASALLRAATDELVATIAYRCGFNDVSHFNHCFKQRFGTSPRAYREDSFATRSRNAPGQ